MLYYPHMKNIEEGTYVVGVSGGPDSMALLDMCRKKGLDLVVAHMNYQKRDTADRDMNLVKEYCDRYQIPFEAVRQTKTCEGNFQAFAREERYRMYKHCMETYHAKGVLLAHHMDDHIETYLMAKKRGSLKEYLGICEETNIMGCRIIRPLLMYSKQDLETYCKENQIPYGIDESNLSNDYERNRIRHEVIDKMTLKEKKELVKKIEEENKHLQEHRKTCRKFIESWDHSLSALRALKEEDLQQVLLMWIHDTCKEYVSMHEIQQISRLIRENANSWTRVLLKEYYIYSEYGKLVIDTKHCVSYEYVYDSIVFEKTPYFEVTQVGSSVEAVTLKKSDFPITIRNVREHDTIMLRFGTKKINRWFIDRKIPKKERKLWPVIVNAEGNVILVPKIGCDIEHFSNNPTLFVLK
ncbi:tRNA lysidine(34) synthetase TilS [Erysipelotrichaceae bacterium HCN-30851]